MSAQSERHQSSFRLCRLSGVVYVADREAGFGLACQEPWIQHATVRDNILFGKDYDPAFYQAVIEACALSDDLNVTSFHAFLLLTLGISAHHCLLLILWVISIT